MENSPDSYKYLCVDNYLTDFLHTQILKSAFETGLIDLLTENSRIGLQELCDTLSIDREGARLLIDLLEQNRVVRQAGSKISLTEEFTEALKYRNLLEVKIEFANYLAPDIANRFKDYILDMDSFMAQSAIFDLFSYHRCYESSKANLATTRKWMNYTTILTQYEAEVFLQHHCISHCKSAMDIGGNSGEFILQLCRANPALMGTVVDLPLVCDIGMEHVNGQAEADRIQFHKADALQDNLPKGFDLITFKSILHDWPDAAVDTYISRAYDSLRLNGDLVIFERVRGDSPAHFPVYGNLPVFIFMRFYRNADLYCRLLEKYGFSEIKIINIQLEMPFVIVSAKKKQTG